MASYSSDVSPNLRTVQSVIIEIIEFMKKKSSVERKIPYILRICEIIRSQILESEDIQWLTYIQNHREKILIASELYCSISSSYEKCVDAEIKNIVFDLLGMKKLKKLCGIINKEQKKSLSNEKYFFKSVKFQIQQYNEKNKEMNQSPTQHNDSGQENFELKENKIEINNLQKKEQDNTMKLQDSFHIDMTELRGDKSTKVTHLEIEIDENQVEGIEDDQPSIIVPDIHDRHHSNIIQNNSLEVGLLSPINPNVNGSYHLINTVEKSLSHDENKRLHDNKNTSQSNEIFLKSLDSRPSIKANIKTKPPLIIDDEIKIRNYARRALYLNEKIKIERVLVYKGPPQVLQSMTVGHLMTNSSYRRCLFQENRSSRLTELYKRHLVVEKRKTEVSITPQKRRITPNQSHEIRMRNDGTSEKVMIPSDLIGSLGESLTFTHENLQHCKYSIVADSRMETMAAMSKSKNFETVLRPIDMANEEPLKMLSPAPQDADKPQQDCQGQASSPEKHLWTFEAPHNSPRKQWKEYQYVTNKLNELWVLSGVKEINAKQLLLSENALNLVNYVTLIRVLDKLSHQRKLFLKLGQNNELLISLIRPQ